MLGLFQFIIALQTHPEHFASITGVSLVNGLREIPVILNNGFSDDINAEAAARMGIRYLEKPVRTENLLRVVGELLHSKRVVTDEC